MSRQEPGWSAEDLAKLPVKSPSELIAKFALTLSPPAKPQPTHAILYLGFISTIAIVFLGYSNAPWHAYVAVLFVLTFTSLVALRAALYGKNTS